MKRLQETDRLEHQLLALGRRVQAQHLHRGLLLLLTAAGVFLLAAFIADVLTRFPYPVRLGLLASAVGYGLWWFQRRALRPAAQRLEAQEVSLLVERAEPGLQSRLISTLQWQEQLKLDAGTSENLVEGLVSQTFGMLGSVHFERIIDTSWRGRSLLRLLLVGLIIAGLAALFPLHTLIFCQRLILPGIEYPTQTRIVSIEMPELIPLGDPIPVRITVDGVVPKLGRLLLESDDGDAIEYDLQPAEPDSPIFAVELSALSQPAVMYIEINDADAGPIRLDPTARPLLETISATITSPAYTGIEQRTEQTGNLRVIEGSRIDMTITTSKPCPGFSLLGLGGETADLPKPQSDGGRAFSFSFTANESFAFSVAMKDEVGLEAADVPQYRVTVIRDRSPTIRIKQPDGSIELAPVSRAPLVFSINDDLGIKSIRIEYTVENGEVDDGQGFTINRELPRTVYDRLDNVGRATFDYNGWWENARTQVVPGQIIRFWIIAEDGAPTPHISQSDEHIIRVISSAEYRRVLWSKLGEHIERVDDLVPDIKSSSGDLEDILERMKP
jgi:hypothetical protein